MKEKIKILFSVAIILLLTATVFMSSVSAAPLPASLRQFGDVDGDGVIGTNDILLINKFRLNKTTFTTLQKEVADVNTDGKIDTEDILRINKHRLQGETNPAYKLITIYWEYKNASGTTVSKKYPYNGNSQIGTLFSPPARKGYRFDGWYTQASGGTKISSTYNVGATSQIFYAHYSIPVTDVTLNKKSATIKVGEIYKELTATVVPSNATNKTVTWSSSNTAVATVNSNGQVKGIKSGTATITVKTKDGGKTKSFIITVKTTYAEKLAQKAESQIGVYGTKKDGTGRGDYQKYGKWYGNNGDYWCAQFVAWCANKAGVPTSIVPKQQSTLLMAQKSSYYISWSKNGKQTLKKIKRGDVIFFSYNQYLSSGGKKKVHHVGIVTKVYPNSNQIEVVEGNTGSDIVARRTYTVDPSTGKITKSLGSAWNGQYFCGYISVP